MFPSDSAELFPLEIGKTHLSLLSMELSDQVVEAFPPFYPGRVFCPVSGSGNLGRGNLGREGETEVD
jgi:hypothetical protein